ncbi:MAG TPA: hypothetical protein VL049_13040 [Candidatus Dormibacteraeota bacterium]|nr:hypothetical protein [Candidatus Dormibacteraeota bacterium]
MRHLHRITAEDVLVWKNETYKLAVEGSLIFHSGERLKSQIARNGPS